MKKKILERNKCQFLIDIVNNKITISDALFRLKILLNDLDSDEINEWIDNELNGYSSNSKIPEYRKYSGQIFGNIQQGYALYSNINIPIKEKFKEIRKINLRENITAIEEFSKFDESKESQLVYPIDINMINAAASIQFDEFTQIYKANMYIPKSVFIGILNNVKSTIINILISLQKKYGYENIDNLNLPIESREKEIEEIKRIIYIGDHAKIKNSIVGDKNVS